MSLQAPYIMRLAACALLAGPPVAGVANRARCRRGRLSAVLATKTKAVPGEPASKYYMVNLCQSGGRGARLSECYSKH